MSCVVTTTERGSYLRLGTVCSDTLQNRAGGWICTIHGVIHGELPMRLGGHTQ